MRANILRRRWPARHPSGQGSPTTFAFPLELPFEPTFLFDSFCLFGLRVLAFAGRTELLLTERRRFSFVLLLEAFFYCSFRAC